MQRTAGEMPFLDHLEELRLRILRSLGALVVAFGTGFWLVQRFKVVNILQQPIAPYLPDGKLAVLSPTDPVMITFKLAFVVGLVLASPVIIWQVWAFLSPALYERERKAMVPSLFAGLILFLLGGAFAWVFVVPKALDVLLQFQAGAFTYVFTYDAYFGFVLQIVLAMGISAELPLLIIILTALGITTPSALGRFRRVAIVLACIAGAVLSPGTDIISMLMMTIPLVLLYEVGIAGSVLVHRRRLRRDAASAALVLAALAFGASPARAQVTGQRRDSLTDTTRVPGRPIDSASARRLGLPSAPSRTFGAPDSVMRALLDLDGYLVTRYLADTASLSNQDRRVHLGGRAMTERDNRILEAEEITYRETSCDLLARGDPKMFDGAQVLVGTTLSYDTCSERGVVDNALTTFADQGANWFLRGRLAVDSSSNRIFGGSNEITSCDLPEAHYHFSAKEVKWVSRSLLVARPAVLYVRDVPVAWIPFLFQETKPGRHSGILVPQFGFNDIVRPTPSYERQVTNVGYYWAPNDYMDASVRFDWYSRRNITWTGAFNYNVLSRFFRGGIQYSRISQSNGGRAENIRWDHQQTFGINTTLRVGLDLSSNTSVVNNNAIDPLTNTATLHSSASLVKRYAWGNLSAGFSRSQTVGQDQVTQKLPTINLSPKPIDIGGSVTWSPTVAFDNTLTTDPKRYLTFPNLAGGIDSVEQTPSSRLSTLTVQTPLRIGTFNWNNSVIVTDQLDRKLAGITTRIPNEATPDPTDSITVDQSLASSFSTRINWETGINLPLLFRGSWKLTPTLGVANRQAGAPFAIRNERTGGQYIVQGKRLSLGLSAAPTLFAFFGGVGPVAAIRHTFAPLITWNWSPKSSVSEEFARAVRQNPNAPLVLTTPATQTVSLSMNNTFEAKERAAPGDTLPGQQARKFKLLGIQTSPLVYDFEQAKEPGKQGWTTQTLNNSISSDLVPNFSLNVTHDLWDREVSSDSARFAPFLQSVSANFGLTSNTFRSIGALFGLGKRPERTAGQGTSGTELPNSFLGNGPLQQRTLQATNQLQGARRPFTANATLTISRTRPDPRLDREGSSNNTLGFSTSFSPTRFWGVTWQTMYNFSTHAFDAQTLRLERDLHDWRAGFNFVKNPNGNFALYFSIHLVDLPDLKFDYNQTTFKR